MQLTSTKSLIIPAKGKQPTFNEVANIVLTGAMCEMSVAVFCLTQELLSTWACRLEQSNFTVSLPHLELLDLNHATLPDWQAFLGSQSYDMTVLHGAQAELRANQLSVEYVKALIDAAPSELVMVA